MLITGSEIDGLERPFLLGYNASFSLGRFLNLFVNVTSDGLPQ